MKTPNKIDSLIVATDMPTINLLPTGVGLPVEGAEVGKMVTPPSSDRDNVVDFPSP